MKQADVQQYKKRLVDRQAELKSQLDEDAESSDVVELDQSRMGRLSRVDALQAQQMAMEAARRHRRELARIARALERVEAGEYGLCMACGEEIDPRRIEIDPAVARCINCAK